MTVLQIRLSNCIQTILELEDDLPCFSSDNVFLSDMSSLKNILQKVSKMDLEEEDVLRLECATANFLEELQPIKNYYPRNKKHIQ